MESAAVMELYVRANLTGPKYKYCETHALILPSSGRPVSGRPFDRQELTPCLISESGRWPPLLCRTAMLPPYDFHE